MLLLNAILGCFVTFLVKKWNSTYNDITNVKRAKLLEKQYASRWRNDVASG